MADFTVSGKQLKTFRNMDLFVQANVVRRFGRLSFIMTIIQDALARGDNLKDTVNANLPAIMMTVGSLNDPDFEYIQNACLDIVEFQSNGAWTKLRAGNALAWGDMTLMDLCMVLAHVLHEVFSPFFYSVAKLSPPPETAASQG